MRTVVRTDQLKSKTAHVVEVVLGGDCVTNIECTERPVDSATPGGSSVLTRTARGLRVPRVSEKRTSRERGHRR